MSQPATNTYASSNDLFSRYNQLAKQGPSRKRFSTFDKRSQLLKQNQSQQDLNTSESTLYPEAQKVEDPVLSLINKVQMF